MNTHRYNLLRSFVESLDTKDHLFKQAVLEGINAIKDSSQQAEISPMAILGLQRIGNSRFYKTKPDRNGNILLIVIDDDEFELDVVKASSFTKWEEIASLYKDIDARGNGIGPKYQMEQDAMN